MRWTILLCFLLVSCASLVDSIDKEDHTFDQVLRAVYAQTSADLQSIKTNFLAGNKVKEHQAITKAEKDVQFAFAQLQKLEDKLANTAKSAAPKADKYNQEHGFWENLNPFHEISLGLGIAMDGVVHAVLLVFLIGIGLAIASVFFPALGPVLSAVWGFLHLVLTSVENVGGIAASGVQKLMSSSSVQPPPIP